MPEARDRLSRPDDAIAAFSWRQISRSGYRNVERLCPIIFDIQDENEGGQSSRTPFRWRGTTMVGTPRPVAGAAGRGDYIGIPRIGRTAITSRRGNLTPSVGSRRARGRGSALPAWYPRRPLNDVTAIMRTIERRRERRRSGEGLQTESPDFQDQPFHTPSTSMSRAHLEQDISLLSPHPTILKKHCPPTIGKIPWILLDIKNENAGDSTCLTPQRKLLNNIDSVEKIVMEELRKIRRTPSAKKVEREKKVRALMAMR